MRKGQFVPLFLFLPALTASPAHAHPVSYQNAISLMAWNQPYMTDWWVTYSYARNGAIAARAMRMEMKDGSEMRVALPQADFLLYRKNARTYQSNFYAFGGYGVERMNNDNSGAGVVGMEADAESRKYYGSVMLQAIYPGIGPDVYSSTVRTGVAAYPSEFDELGTWFIVAYQENHQLSRRSDVTPYVRFMFRNVLAEIGAGFHGDTMINFMIHY